MAGEFPTVGAEIQGAGKPAFSGRETGSNGQVRAISPASVTKEACTLPQEDQATTEAALPWEYTDSRVVNRTSFEIAYLTEVSPKLVDYATWAAARAWEIMHELDAQVPFTTMKLVFHDDYVVPGPDGKPMSVAGGYSFDMVPGVSTYDDDVMHIGLAKANTGDGSTVLHNITRISAHEAAHRTRRVKGVPMKDHTNMTQEEYDTDPSEIEAREIELLVFWEQFPYFGRHNPKYRRGAEQLRSFSEKVGKPADEIIRRKPLIRSHEENVSIASANIGSRRNVDTPFATISTRNGESSPIITPRNKEKISNLRSKQGITAITSYSNEISRKGDVFGPR